MRFLRPLSVALCALSVAAPAFANPDDMTCKFLSVIGANDKAGVPGMLAEIASGLPEDRLTAATESLSAMVDAPIFDGGSAWRIASFGDDIQEHLVLLRLSAGEIAGGRLRYEWSPDGMSLVSLEFQRQYADYIGAGVLMTPEQIDCGS